MCFMTLHYYATGDVICISLQLLIELLCLVMRADNGVGNRLGNTGLYIRSVFLNVELLLPCSTWFRILGYVLIRVHRSSHFFCLRLHYAQHGNCIQVEMLSLDIESGAQEKSQNRRQKCRVWAHTRADN